MLNSIRSLETRVRRDADETRCTLAPIWAPGGRFAEPPSPTFHTLPPPSVHFLFAFIHTTPQHQYFLSTHDVSLALHSSFSCGNKPTAATRLSKVLEVGRAADMPHFQDLSFSFISSIWSPHHFARGVRLHVLMYYALIMCRVIHTQHTPAHVSCNL